MVGQTISHYTVLRELGRGGSGKVYLALDTKLQRQVVLKLLNKGQDEAAPRRLLREARAAAALDHPFICKIHEVGEFDGGHFIVMEYVEGKTLAEQLTEGPLPMKDAFRIAAEVAEALEVAHQKEIVHRDLKPHNIMLASSGHVKLMDFGIAGHVVPPDTGQDAVLLTLEDFPTGTFPYMSPEQTWAKPIDTRSDIFSLGIVLFEMLTGTNPFYRKQRLMETALAVLNEPPPPLTDYLQEVPELLDQTVRKMLAKNPEERFQHIHEVRANLAQLLGEAAPMRLQPRLRKRTDRLRRPWLVGAAAAALVGIAVFAFLEGPSFFTDLSVSTDRKSIAVLPFDSLSMSSANNYFSDGMTEDIITQLSKIQDLKVISRSSVMRYKNQPRDIREIAAELDVATILEGSVRREGNRVRITAQLIDAKTDQHLWAETYDRELNSIFAIQSDVAQQIAAALEVELSPSELGRIAKAPTVNLTAYDFYLKGREYYNRYHKQENENAIELFGKAQALDPGFALAFAGLADAYSQRFQSYGFGPEWVDAAIAMSERAIAADGDRAEGYRSLGLAYSLKGWVTKSLEANLEAAKRNPNIAASNVAYNYINRGEFDQAMLWSRRALRLSPTRPWPYVRIGTIYSDLNDYLQAEQWLNQALEVEPDFTWAHWQLGNLYLRQGKLDRAARQAEQTLFAGPDFVPGLSMAGTVALRSGDYQKARERFEEAIRLSSSAAEPGARLSLGYILRKAGDRAGGERLLSQVLDQDRVAIESGNERWDARWRIAAVQAIRGEKEEACRWLREAANAGWRGHDMTSQDPLFESLHQDDRFIGLMAEVRGTVEEMRKKVEAVGTP